MKSQTLNSFGLLEMLKSPYGGFLPLISTNYFLSSSTGTHVRHSLNFSLFSFFLLKASANPVKSQSNVTLSSVDSLLCRLKRFFLSIASFKTLYRLWATIRSSFFEKFSLVSLYFIYQASKKSSRSASSASQAYSISNLRYSRTSARASLCFLVTSRLFFVVSLSSMLSMLSLSISFKRLLITEETELVFSTVHYCALTVGILSISKSLIALIFASSVSFSFFFTSSSPIKASS